MRLVKEIAIKLLAALVVIVCGLAGVFGYLIASSGGTAHVVEGVALIVVAVVVGLTAIVKGGLDISF